MHKLTRDRLALGLAILTLGAASSIQGCGGDEQEDEHARRQGETAAARQEREAPPEEPGRDRADVRLGIRPWMAAGADGVLLDGVSSGGSADRAGLQSGDVIVAWDDDRIRNLGDLMQHLRAHDPGDRVKVTIKRDGERLDVDVTLQASTGGRD